MYYDKKIRYIDYLENGEKQHNGGYVKITVMDGRLLLEMQIKGLYETDDVTSEVVLEGAGSECRIGTVIIRQGSGSLRWELEDPIHTGEDIMLCRELSYGQLERIVVQLSSRRNLQCVWREIRGEEAPQPLVDSGDDPEKAKQQEMPEETEPMGSEPLITKAEETEIVDNGTTGEMLLAEEEAVEQDPPRPTPHAPRSVPMSEDKWLQLQHIYPHIRPFKDDREYLSLRPQDFVILRENAYRLVRNSFLLHGFYNYEHLILAKVSQKGEIRYYIGVPGNFYEKEKQVAIMFGFESFECGQEPAQEGDFGYYMIRAEI